MDMLQLPGEFQNVRVSVFSVWPPKIRPQTERIYEQQGILASPVPNPFTSWRGQSKASSHLHFPFLVLMTPPLHLPPPLPAPKWIAQTAAWLSRWLFTRHPVISQRSTWRHTRPHFTFLSNFQGNLFCQIGVGQCHH